MLETNKKLLHLTKSGERGHLGGSAGRLKTYISNIIETMSCLQTLPELLTGYSHLKKLVRHFTRFKI